MSARAPKRTIRVFALALACLTLVSNVASLAHLVLVQHVSCEHGELIDVGRPGAAVARDGARAGDRHDAPSAIDGAGSESHGHEHCLLAPTRRDRLGVLGKPIGHAHALRPCLTGYRREVAFVAPAIALLALAPKSSPPLA